MAGTLITVTDVGRAALVSQGNDGTAAHKVVEIGLASSPFAADKAMKALPGERKRIKTFAGENVAPDTIHVTVKDDTADQFTLYGFGLYLENGVLFAAYGQAAPIMEKSPEALLLLSADMQFAAIDAAQLVFGDASFTNPPATTERQGVVRLSTNPEAIAGTDTKTAVTPAGLQAALGPALALKADKQHRHSLVDVDGLQVALDGKSPIGHRHVIADVAGLQSALDDRLGVGGGNVTGNVRLKSAGIYSPSLSFDASGYAPFLRSNSSAQTLEAVNGANTQVNLSLSEDGALNLPRARPRWAGLTPWDNGNLDPYTKSGGPLNTDAAVQTANTYGKTAFRVAAADDNGIGGSFASWNSSRTPALQVDAPNPGAAYAGIRWTRWSVRHLAGIDVYEGGSAASEPTIVMHIDQRPNAWTFGRGEINRGNGGYVWGTWNLDPVKARNNTATRGYVVSDSASTIAINWDGANQLTYVDGYYQGAMLTHLNFNNWAAARGSQIQRAGATQSFGLVAGNPILPNPWVVVGLTGPGNGTANAITVYGDWLRNS